MIGRRSRPGPRPAGVIAPRASTCPLPAPRRPIDSPASSHPPPARMADSRILNEALQAPAAAPSGLNKAQMEAVHHLDSPCLVLAGAGSGKTRVITFKIVRLLQSGLQPKQI